MCVFKTFNIYNTRWLLSQIIILERRNVDMCDANDLKCRIAILLNFLARASCKAWIRDVCIKRIIFQVHAFIYERLLALNKNWISNNKKSFIFLSFTNLIEKYLGSIQKSPTYWTWILWIWIQQLIWYIILFNFINNITVISLFFERGKLLSLPSNMCQM